MGELEKKQCSLFHENGERCVLEEGHFEKGVKHRLPDAHRCHARGCVVPVKPELLMCRAHWFRVPRAIQRAVWAEYRVGQCDDKNPSASWYEAANAAIGYVATLDDQPLLVSEMNALKKFGYVVQESDGGLRAVLAGKA